MNKKFQILLISGACIAFLLLFIFCNNNRIRIAYVDYNKIYESFYLKHDLEEEYEKVVKKRDFIIDSLRSNLHFLNEQILKTDNENMKIKFFELQKELNSKKHDFDEQNKILADQYNSLIFEKMNINISDFGKEHSYNFIIGNSNMILLHADSVFNVTEEVIKYIHEKNETKTK